MFALPLGKAPCRSFLHSDKRTVVYYDISSLSFESKVHSYDQRMLTHAPWVPAVLLSSFMCHGSEVSCGINLKQWKFSETIKRPPHCSCSCPVPFPHLSLFTGRRGIAFLQTPLPIRHFHTHIHTHAHIRDWAELLSDLAGARTGGKSGEERWGLKHTTLVVSLTTQTPDKTTTDRCCAA